MFTSFLHHPAMLSLTHTHTHTKNQQCEPRWHNRLYLLFISKVNSSHSDIQWAGQWTSPLWGEHSHCLAWSHVCIAHKHRDTEEQIEIAADKLSDTPTDSCILFKHGTLWQTHTQHTVTHSCKKNSTETTVLSECDLLTWFSPLVCCDTVDTPLRLITEGQPPHEDEAPSPLRWDFAQLQVHGTVRLAHPHMISSSSIGHHKPRTTLQDLPGKKGQIVVWWAVNIDVFLS